MKKTIVFGWLRIVFGLLIFSFGVHLTIKADLGLAPWDCLGMGIANHTPLNYGLAMTMIALILLGIDLLLKEKIGFGTILDALLTGNFIQLFNDIDTLPIPNNTFLRILIILLGLAVMAIGQYFYMKSAQCCGPRDALLVGVGKRMKKVPIGFVQLLILALVLLGGWLLGGKIGIGTVVCAFGTGLVMQLVYKIIGFEPRQVEHKSVIETIRALKLP
ncbi:MAG: hypothetical protein IKE65_05010 [Clostridia bacterium]|nr:hypothetical protein [Clostridia bacterium]